MKTTTLILMSILILASGCAAHRSSDFSGGGYNRSPHVIVSQVDCDKTVDRAPVATGSMFVSIKYPINMRRAGITGEVIVRFLVTEKGQVREMQVLKSTQPEFEPAISESRQYFRFFPAYKADTPTSSWVDYEFKFTFDDDSAGA